MCYNYFISPTFQEGDFLCEISYCTALVNCFEFYDKHNKLALL